MKTTKIKTTIDASGKSIGRLATEIAKILLAKNSTSFAKNFVAGVTVEVLNASKVKITGDKMNQNVHKRYSGYPSGLKLPNWKEVSGKKGYGELIRHAVEGMLPKNKLQGLRLQNLTIKE